MLFVVTRIIAFDSTEGMSSLSFYRDIGIHTVTHGEGIFVVREANFFEIQKDPSEGEEVFGLKKVDGFYPKYV